MLHGEAYNNLKVLTKTIGNRLSGTPQAAKAVLWAEKTLKAAGADKVWLQPVEVPMWFRGEEHLSIKFPGSKIFEEIPMLSLGNSQGTDGKVLQKKILMVPDFEAFKKLSKKEVVDAFVFFNFRFPQEELSPFTGYGIANSYRWNSANLASLKGAAGVIIRSVSTGMDDAPHTGSMRYADTVKPIPAVAIGNFSADRLEQACKNGNVSAQLVSHAKMMGTTTSYNVIGEIIGTDFPDEIILIGGHLDSWDVGEGAHDDGAGTVQSIEVMRTINALNLKPKRTVRTVLFMNEENGLKGGYAYADSAKANNERHILAIETDAGGFSPRGIGMEMSASKRKSIAQYAALFLPYGVYDFDKDEGGADISPLQKAGVPVAGLLPDPQRYFDLHHTQNDVFETVNHRELKLGAVVLTQLVYLISKYGLPE